MRPWSRSGMSVVTGLLLVWTSLGIDAHESAVTIMSSQATRHQRGRPVGKSVVSSKLRLVFFAGLEGTGHHYVSNVFTKLYDTYPDVEAIVSCHIGTNVFLPRTMSENALHYQESQDNLRSALQELAVLEENLSPEGTIVTVQKTSRLQKKCHVGIGQLSFPNLHGPDKALSYPDLQLLARIAEEEGIDFRVLYLQRSAEEILLSDTAHRRFHEYSSNTPTRQSPPKQYHATYSSQVQSCFTAGRHFSPLTTKDPRSVNDLHTSLEPKVAALKREYSTPVGHMLNERPLDEILSFVASGSLQQLTRDGVLYYTRERESSSSNAE